MLRTYGGYIGAIKDGESRSEACRVETENPLEVVSKLQQECQYRYPEKEGWKNHSTSQADGVVIYKQK